MRGGRGAGRLHRLGPDRRAFRELMRQWKAAGRADRDRRGRAVGRFRAAQDKFFAGPLRGVLGQGRRAARARRGQGRSCSTEAQALLPVTDVRAARSALRGIQEKLGAVGAVPRDVA